MSAVVIVGAQWGDEGKGKATDLLGPRVDYVVKPNGGNNAGHTVVVNGQKFELKLLPAGILSENAVPVIGNGVVVNPEALFAEIDGLEARGADTSRLKISDSALAEETLGHLVHGLVVGCDQEIGRAHV